jgi:glycosyltransferase involved in cell wall biosynthesis
MRILLVHNRYRSGAPSGENRVVDQEGEALSALGHEVMRFGRSSDEIEQWSMAKKASLPARTVWSRETYRDLKASLREHRPEVVHVHNTFPLLSDAVLYACRDAGVPVVATMHNYRLVCSNGMFFRSGTVCHDCTKGLPVRAVVHGCYRESHAATVPVALARSLHRQAWRSLVSAYVFISASQRDLHRGLGLAPDRVFVRYNLIPRHGRPQVVRTPAVVYAGRLHEAKGVRLLMAGWDCYRRKSEEPGLNLVIVGGGPLEDEVAAWASARPSVEMTGTVSGDRCAELISRARAVLLPSVWEETFGLVAVEAMAAGVPPIAAGHGSFTELITPGVDGALFSPGDPAALALAIADVEKNPEQYEVYGDQARKTYEQRFDPQRSVEELLEIYRFAITHPVMWALSWPGPDHEYPRHRRCRLNRLQTSDLVVALATKSLSSTR